VEAAQNGPDTAAAAYAAAAGSREEVRCDFGIAVVVAGSNTSIFGVVTAEAAKC
jgi:hypothetical protein